MIAVEPIDLETLGFLPSILLQHSSRPVQAGTPPVSTVIHDMVSFHIAPIGITSTMISWSERTNS